MERVFNKVAKAANRVGTLRCYFYIVLVQLLLASVLFLSVASGESGQSSVVLKGRISESETGIPIGRVTIRIDGTGRSTLSNDDGYYSLALVPGTYTIRFSHVSHHTEAFHITITDSSTTRDIELPQAICELGVIRVYSQDYDPAQAIIAEAIMHKREIIERLSNCRYDAYTKNTIYDESDPDSSKIFMIVESQITAYWSRPDKFKEIVTSRRSTANINAGNVILGVGEFLNFNRDRIELDKYSIISPTARDAMDHYDYYLIDTLIIDGRRVFRLEIEPKNALEPLCAGVIHILDSTYDVVEVDVAFTESVHFPLFSGLKYSQLCAQFQDSLWMPVEIRYAVDVKLGVPLPGLPSSASLLGVASIYNYEFDSSWQDYPFDECVVEVANGADVLDSAAWAKRQTIPLTAAESAAYRRIDSLANLPKSLPKRIVHRLAAAPMLLTGLAPDFFHFNRAEGIYGGASANINPFSPKLDLGLRLGYADGAGRWEHRLSVKYHLPEQREFYVGFHYHNEIVRRASIISNHEPTFTALFFKIDPYDYYLERGFVVRSGFRAAPKTYIQLRYTDFVQRTVGIATDYSFFRSKHQGRPNPAISDGRLRSMAATLTLDTRPLFKIKGRIRRVASAIYTRVTVGVEHSSPGILKSDFDFRSYWIDLLIRARVPGLDIGQVRLTARHSDGQLPVQRLYTVDHGPVIWFDERGFATLNESNFHGDRVVCVYWHQSLGRLLFERSRLPLLSLLPFEAAVHGGIFWSDLRFRPDGWHNWTRVATVPYREIGFGLSNIAPFLGILNPSVHFTWQLSSYDTSRFRFHCGVIGVSF